MAKKFLISGYYGFNNFGDDAILKVIIQGLKKNSDNPQITVFSSNPELTKNIYDVDSKYSFDYTNLFKEISNTDVLISGGGSLLQDVTSLKSLVYYLGILFMAKLTRKKIVIFAQGIGPIKNKAGNFLTRIALSGVENITVRDKKSHELLKSWDIDSQIVPDPVWNMEIPVFEKNFNEIGVQLRDYHSVDKDKLTKIAHAVNAEFGNKKINIISLQDAHDLKICQEFEAILRKTNPSISTQIYSGLSIEEAVEVLSKQAYLIAMRYHACLLAIKAGVPTLAISYDIKVNTLAEESAIPCVEINKIDEIFNKISELKNINSQSLFDFTLKKVSEKSINFSDFC